MEINKVNEIQTLAVILHHLAVLEMNRRPNLSLPLEFSEFLLLLSIPTQTLTALCSGAHSHPPQHTAVMCPQSAPTALIT